MAECSRLAVAPGGATATFLQFPVKETTLVDAYEHNQATKTASTTPISSIYESIVGTLDCCTHPYLWLRIRTRPDEDVIYDPTFSSGELRYPGRRQAYPKPESGSS